MKKSLLIALGLTVNVGLYAQLSTGLVAYYPFNGNSNDASGNGNNSTANTATLTTDRNGVTNAAYNFDGNQYIQIPGNLTNTPEFTISLWFETHSLINPNTIQRMICFSDLGAGKQRASLNFNNSDLNLVDARVQGHATNGESLTIYGQNELVANEWHHAVLVMTKIDDPLGNPPFYFYVVDLYIDGAINYDAEIYYDPVIADNGFIGSFSAVSNQTMLGKIDDIAIYSRALGSSEITQLFNGDNPLAAAEIGKIESNNLFITPNPTSSNITIELETSANLVILSSEGKVVAALSGASNYNFDARNLENGIYFIQTENGGVQKFVKQ